MKQTFQKIGWVVLLMVSFISLGATGWAADDIAEHADCPYCGMNRATFAHSRFLIQYNDGSSVGTCSLHCAAIDMALKIDKSPKALMVGDYQSKELIDAEKAFWVLGGDKMGVMTLRAKWAFKKTEDAEKFVAENGGELVPFDASVQASFEDMYKDITMIRKKREKMRMRKLSMEKPLEETLVKQ
ncbi:NosL family protein [Desulfoluna limicola]|uniref:NosL family protein n=1 Tax=Desulfoluna limicola TaxID=2810562 RepID=A0ABM7PNT7_9BACT|nr:nitrous oxide reductase accessory protein NosL [Desulfoluna limicola]BCS98756.1 NosL family protein [Desulfoluna limicola]